MSIQELKQQLVTLPRKEQDEVIAFLFHLRHGEEADYVSVVTRRSQDADPSHWLSPDDFARRLDRKLPG